MLTLSVYTCRYCRRTDRRKNTFRFTDFAILIHYRFYRSFFFAPYWFYIRTPSGFTILEHYQVLPFDHPYRFPGPIGFRIFTNFAILPIPRFYQFYHFGELAGFTTLPFLTKFRPYRFSILPFYHFGPIIGPAISPLPPTCDPTSFTILPSLER